MIMIDEEEFMPDCCMCGKPNTAGICIVGDSYCTFDCYYEDLVPDDDGPDEDEWRFRNE